MNEHQQLLEKLEQHEQELQFTEFGNEAALALGMGLVEAARRERKAITIDICRNGQQLFHCAMAGTSADNDAWIRRKEQRGEPLRTQLFFCRDGLSCAWEELRHRCAPGSGSVRCAWRRVSSDRARGGVIGTITVSGLPQAEDHEFVVREIRAFLNSRR